MKSYDYAIRALHRKYGECNGPIDPIEIYTYNVSVAASNMSALIRAYIIEDNRPTFLCETRIQGCGLDRGHELAYNLFCLAYPNARYQDHLHHRWL